MKIFILVIFAFLVTCSCYAQKGVIVKDKIADFVLDTLMINPEERFALVIGNEKYGDTWLKNPVNDAKGISDLLQNYGFKVTLKTDMDEEAMILAIREFGDMVHKQRGVGLFYFSGHGLQHDSHNYLLPLNCNLVNEADIPKETVQLDKILQSISYSKNGLNIVILDACRNSSFYNTLKNTPRGLTYSLNKVRNTLIFYATSANDVAEDGEGHNSPFTEAFINVLKRADTIELLQVAKQIVWDVEKKTNERQTPQFVCTMKNDFYFRKQVSALQPKLFVLSIGISKYQDSAHDLKYGSKGARDFAGAFQKNSAIPYEASNAYYLENKDATYVNIWRLIQSIRLKARSGDLILVYFNGLIEADWEGFFLMPYDAAFERADERRLSHEKLLSVLSGLPCKSMLFLDGAASLAVNDKNSLLEIFSRARNNVIVLSACGKDGNMLISENTENTGSIFTTAIGMALKNAESKEKPGFIDVESLADYVIAKTKTLSNGHQTPAIYYPRGWQNFIIAKKL